MLFGYVREESKTKHVTLFLVIAVVLRFALFTTILVYHPDGFLQTDSSEYWNISENLIEHGRYSQNESEPLVPDHRRTPLYPIFVTLFRLLRFGVPGIIIMQLFLSLFNVILATEIAHKLFNNHRVTLISGLLIALDVPSIVFANTLLTETLFTTLFMLAILYAIEHFKKSRIKELLISGIFLGLAVVCRPVALFFPGVLLFLLLFLSPKDKKLFLVKIPIFLGTFLLMLAPWLIRNQVVFQSPFISTISNTNMLEYRAAGVYAVKERISLSEARHRLVLMTEQTFGESKNDDPIGYIRHQSEQGVRIILSNPGIYIRNNIRSTISLFLNPLRSTIDLQLGLTDRSSTLKQWGNRGGTGLLSRLFARTSVVTIIIVFFQILHLSVLWLAILIGIVKTCIEKRFLSFFLILLTLFYFAIIVGGPEAYARFRVPIVPLLAAMAGYGISFAVEFLQKKNAKI